MAGSGRRDAARLFWLAALGGATVAVIAVTLADLYAHPADLWVAGWYLLGGLAGVAWERGRRGRGR